MPGKVYYLPVYELTAITNPQFAIGPQKCVVRGPVGEFQNVWALETNPPACLVALIPCKQLATRAIWQAATGSRCKAVQR